MNKIAVITGGSTGIGAATAIRLAEQGVDSIITYRKHEKEVHEVAEEVRKKGAKAMPIYLDVGDAESFPKFKKDVESILAKEWKTEKFDYLVNNAGFGKMVMFEETSVQLFDEYSRVILKGPYFLTQELLPILRDGGAIVNTTSNSALPTGWETGYSAYASMKGGLMTLTVYMAKELGKRRIRVNSVAPGPTRTRIAEDAFSKYPEVIPPIIAQTVLGRLGEADDIGSVIAAVLSDSFRWVTGQNIEASGGWKL